MLDLQAGVHLEEVELVLLAIDDEFDSAGGVIADGFCQCHGLFAHGLAVAASRKGEGASSMTFWFRRWIEHSRSPR